MERARRGPPRELVAGTWAEDGTYLDPLMAGEGADGIAAMIGAAQQQFPGHRFELTTGPDAHNGHVRFAWKLVGDAGPVAPASTSPRSPTTAACAPSPASSSPDRPPPSRPPRG